jgi:signal transduction histidine kinase
MGSENLLRSSILNIIENACKFSTHKKAHACIQTEGNWIIIKVKNEGKGIPEADIPYIFQPFFRAENTASSKGYGIGLSLVERIVLLHNGQISVQSEINGLTEFTLRFPMV